MDRHRIKIILVLPPLLFLGLFYFYPIVRIVVLSLKPGARWDLAALRNLVRTGYYGRVLWFTTWQAAVSTLLTLAVGLPGAYLFSRYRFPGRKLLQAFTTVPFVLPTVVVAAAFEAFLGPHGIVNENLKHWFCLAKPPIRLEHTVFFILLAHVFYNYTVVVRLVGSFWAHLHPGVSEAARMLGASPWKAFRTITLPLLRPAIVAASLLVFIFCFSSFGIILILGGPRYATLEVEIYRQAVHLFNLPIAAALSVIQIGFTFILMWRYTGLQRQSSIALMPEAVQKTEKRAETRRERLLLALGIGFIVVFLGLPLLSLMVSSVLTDSGLSLHFYRSLFTNPNQSVFFVPPIQAVFNSLGFATLTLLMALALGTSAAVFLAGRRDRFSALLDPLFMLPLSTSAVTLGFGFIIALDRPPLDLRTSFWLVPIAHCLVAFPFVVRSLLPALRSIPRTLREAATLLGAPPWQVWRTVDLPIMSRALVVAAVFAATISLGEFGATVFVARPQRPTMPLAIYRFLGQPGTNNYGQAMAMSSLLMVVSAVAFMALERVRFGQAGEF